MEFKSGNWAFMQQLAKGARRYREYSKNSGKAEKRCINFATSKIKSNQS